MQGNCWRDKSIVYRKYTKYMSIKTDASRGELEACVWAMPSVLGTCSTLLPGGVTEGQLQSTTANAHQLAQQTKVDKSTKMCSVFANIYILYSICITNLMLRKDELIRM